MRRRHFQITTANGHRAIINGDPNMKPATRRALGELIDAAVRAIVIDKPLPKQKRRPTKPIRKRKAKQ